MSPSASFERFLAQMEYPATKDDLLREAARDGVTQADLESLHRLDEGSYGAKAQVLAAVRAVGELVVA